MSSNLPSRDNDYQLAPAPARTVFDRPLYNHVFGDVGGRLRALEAKRVELQDIIDDLRLFGLDRLDTAVVPLIEQTQQQIIVLQQAVADTTTANSQIIEQIQAEALLALATLEAEIDAVEYRVNTILAGGIPAADVAEDANRVFVSPGQRDKIGEVDSKINVDAQTISSKVTATQNARLVFKDLADNIRALFSLNRETNDWSVVARHPADGDINTLLLSGGTAGQLLLNGEQVFHNGMVPTAAQAASGSDNTLPMTPLGVSQHLAARRGAANGVASLDGSGKVPASQLPTEYGAVGTYVIAASSSWAISTEYLPDTTVAGSTLYRGGLQAAGSNNYVAINADINTTVGNMFLIHRANWVALGLSGTWRLMTRVNIGNNATGSTLGLFMRIA